MTNDQTPPDTSPTVDGGAGEANDIPEVYEMETLEQLRAIADELRTRIVEALIHRPMTVTQVGELLGQAPAKIHYHVRELERVGLIRLVATREKSGILEKYYRAVARSLTASKTLLLNTPTDEAFAAMRSYLDNTSRAFLRAADYTLRNQLWENPKIWGLSTAQIWVTQEEMKALGQRVQAEFDKYTAPRGIAGEEERTFVMMGYDPRIAEQAGTVPPLSTPPTPPTPPTPQPESTQSSGKPPRGARSRHIVMAGAVSLRRSDLEEAIAQNRQLDISAIGVCTVPDDVTPDLIERAIGRFRHRGVLNASAKVRDALTRKE